jgi:AcrR family transcriptional regulator
VAENQRWRLLGATAEVLAESGLAGVSSRTVSARAGVSKGAFYRHFDNVDDCLLAVHEMVRECVEERVADARAGVSGRPAQVRAAVDAIASFFAIEPSLASTLSIAVAGNAAIAASRESLIERLAATLDADPRCVAAALALTTERIATGEVERLPALAPELTELLAAVPAATAG